MNWNVKDSHDRALLIVARSWGVSPSRFMNEAKPQLIRTNSNGDQVVSSVEEWTLDDRQAALDLYIWESECCPGCGYPLSETSLPEHEFAYKGGLAVRCFRCTTSEHERKKYESSDAPSALLIPVVLKTEGDGDGSSSDSQVTRSETSE
jgi:hypothetical protein